MSYLNSVRLVFSGTFQADVSTVNNDVRHYDNATFEPRFQQLQDFSGGPLNGWFHPTGSGAFRLIDCRVRSVCYADGSSTEDAAKDPVVGMHIGGSSDRVSGKIVDLDPQWQMASQLWGLEMRLTDGHTPDLLGGRYRPHAFRDLIIARSIGQSLDGGASAVFQSVLESVTWAKNRPSSRFLDELQQTTQAGCLSVRLCTFGYVGNPRDPRYTLGFVSGVIGPSLEGEPESFVLGRRFTPADGIKSWLGINFFNAWLDTRAGLLLIDLGNALPLDNQGNFLDIGELSVGVLMDDRLTEKDALGPASFTGLGAIAYESPGWLLDKGAIHACPIPPEMMHLLRDAGNPRPLALAARPRGSQQVPSLAIRESAQGLFVCAEPLALRIDSPGGATVTLHAARHGQPLAGATLEIKQLGRQKDLGGSGFPNEPQAPRAPIPDAGVPEEAVRFPSTLTTDDMGRAVLPIEAKPPGSPRGYIDGQLYLFDYRLRGQPNNARNLFDFICLHLRDAYEIPASPTWAQHVQPILVQYANLYPIMSQKLLNLSDPRDIERHRNLLELAFSLDIDDPNHMPVTRDLSEPKRRMILQWLRSLSQGLDPTFAEALEQARQQVPAEPRAALMERAAPEAVPSQQVEPSAEEGSKTRFARIFKHALDTAKPR